jgi:phosphatidylglycerophosphatase C
MPAKPPTLSPPREAHRSEPKASPKKAHQKKKLVLFDFDGTITTKDTLIEFLRYYKGPLKVLAGFLMLSPVLAMYSLKVIPNWKAKQTLLKWFVAGEDLARFNTQCREFARRILPRLIRPKALHIIEQYRRDQATVVVISASAENWVQPWCEQNDLICLATQLDVQDGKLTGNFCGKNCYGPEKVRRLLEKFDLKDFDEIIAYGDSSGDREMFSIAHQKFFKPFRS